MNLRQPSILGGNPLASPALPFARPVLPSIKAMETRYAEILSRGMVTNGTYLEQFEQCIQTHLQVKHAVAVSSCTTGLVLAMQSLSLPKEAEVILPSFTFMASAIAPVWNGHRIQFADIDKEMFTISPSSVEQTLTPQTAAIVAVPIFGNPVAIPELKMIAERQNLKMLFDSAHGFGTLQNGVPIGGNGEAEVFSLSPTKLLIAGEGGIVATNHDEVARHVRWGRNYGNPGNYDSLFCGMNARMSEFHAICALESLNMLEEAAARRNRIVDSIKERLSNLPGIKFQKVNPNDRCSYKDFSIVIDDEFGLPRDVVKRALEEEGISTRVYFSPTLHKMTAYKHYAEPNIHERLPNTLWLEERILTLPLYSDMTESEASIVCEALECIHHHRDEIKKQSV